MKAARWIMARGPKHVIIKKGEHGAFMFNASRHLLRAGLSARERVRSDRRGRFVRRRLHGLPRAHRRPERGEPAPRRGVRLGHGLVRGREVLGRPPARDHAATRSTRACASSAGSSRSSSETARERRGSGARLSRRRRRHRRGRRRRSTASRRSSSRRSPQARAASSAASAACSACRPTCARRVLVVERRRRGHQAQGRDRGRTATTPSGTIS